MRQNVIAIRVDSRRAAWPQRTNQVQPTFEPFAKLARPGIIGASKLCGEAKISEDGNAFLLFRGETAVRESHEQIQGGQCARQRFRRFEISWYRMCCHLAKEFVAEDNFIFEAAGQ